MRFLKADSFFDGKKFLPGNIIMVLDAHNALKELIDEKSVDPGSIERVKGIVTPGFINAHCHLELSHLKDKINRHTGLPAFARQVITQRGHAGKEEIAEQMQAADAAMWQSGIVAVGDISNGSDSFNTKAQSSIFYHTFIELIGLDPARAPLIFDKGAELAQALKNHNLKGSLAPHAPYSTSTALIKTIAEHDANMDLPLSIHNQESEEEAKFFEGLPNGFNELFSFLGLDLSWFKAPGGSSLQSYVQVLSAVKPSLLVHNTLTTANDMLSAAAKNIYWCLCPGANLYIENRLPDFNVFKGLAHKICLGTDSLASNAQLDVLAEANIILSNTGAFAIESILSSLTSNAAEALNITDNFGNFTIGKNAGLNLVTFENEHLQFIKKLA